jgi:hypothetical protein
MDRLMSSTSFSISARMGMDVRSTADVTVEARRRNRPVPDQ